MTVGKVIKTTFDTDAAMVSAHGWLADNAKKLVVVYSGGPYGSDNFVMGEYNGWERPFCVVVNGKVLRHENVEAGKPLWFWFQDDDEAVLFKQSCCGTMMSGPVIS